MQPFPYYNSLSNVSPLRHIFQTTKHGRQSQTYCFQAHFASRMHVMNVIAWSTCECIIMILFNSV